MEVVYQGEITKKGGATMRRLAMMLLLGICVALVSVPSGSALSCIARTPAEHLEAAQVVIVGEVIQAPARPGNGARPHVVKVDRVFKGEAGATITILHNEMMGPDIALQMGQRYLLFLNWNPETGGWRTSLCSGSQGLPGGMPAQFAGVLGEGYEPGDAPEAPPAAEKGWSPPGWVIPSVLLAAAAGGLMLLVQVRRRG